MSNFLSLRETEECSLGSAGTGPCSCDRKGALNRGTSSMEQREIGDIGWGVIGWGVLSVEQGNDRGL